MQNQERPEIRKRNTKVKGNTVLYCSWCAFQPWFLPCFASRIACYATYCVVQYSQMDKRFALIHFSGFPATDPASLIIHRIKLDKLLYS